MVLAFIIKLVIRQPLSLSVAAVWKVLGSTPTADRQFSEIKFSACTMSGAVGSLKSSGILGAVDLDSIPARAAGFNHVMTLSKLRKYTCALANQAIHPFGVGKLVPAICRG